MIIAIPSSADKPDALIDERFSRCSFFCLFYTDTKNLTFKENTFRNTAAGVGPQVVEFLANCGVSEVYAREFGPKAKNTLEKLNIRMRLVESNQTVHELIKKLNF